MMKVSLRAVLLLVSGLALTGVLAVRDVSVQAGGIRPAVSTVALEGDPAPGISGVTISRCNATGDAYSFDEPMTNAAGDVIYYTCLSDGGWAFYLKPFGATPTLVVRSGQVLPGVGTLPSSSVDEFVDGPAINNRGTSIFAIRQGISGTGAPESAQFMKTRNGNLQAVVKTGDPSPCGGTFRRFDDMSLNNKDDIAFIATYDDTTIKAGVFLRKADGTIDKIVCNGDSLPGTGEVGAPNEKFNGTATNGLDGPWLNDSRIVVFQADLLTGPQVTDPDSGDTESKWAGSAWVKRPGGSIESFIIVGDAIPESVGGGVVHGLAIGRPAFNNDGVLAFNLSRETFTDTHPAEQFIASKQLGSGSGIDICLEDLGPAPEGGTFEGFGAVTINQKGDLAFNAEIDTDPSAEDPDNPEADNTRGILTCKNQVLTMVVRQSDSNKPRGGQWSHQLEETSSYGPFIVFDNEVSPTGASPDRGVFLAGSQQDPIQGNFLCPDGHVDDRDILHLLQFVGGVPGIAAASSSCPTLGQAETRSGFKWGDVNCNGVVDVADVTFMLADRAGVPRTPATANCFQIGEVIT
jgi:hypothetical protein